MADCSQYAVEHHVQFLANVLGEEPQHQVDIVETVGQMLRRSNTSRQFDPASCVIKSPANLLEQASDVDHRVGIWNFPKMAPAPLFKE